MNINPEQSLSDNLAANGFGHRPGDAHGRRVIFRSDTHQEIGAMDYKTAWEWLHHSAEARSRPPRKGDVVTYRGQRVGTVTSIDGNLCWRTYPDGEAMPFIWRFHNGTLNTLHTWHCEQG